MEQVRCRLALEDGTIVQGQSFGAPCNTPICGEVVFTTSMTGYQEALTDPSYSGQILIMTAPEIGNYGVNAEDAESKAPQVAGFVVKELSRIVSNFRSDNNLSDWLRDEGTPCITGVDTRAIVRRIRQEGALRGALSTNDSITDEALVAFAKESPMMAGQDLASGASTDDVHGWSEQLGEWNTHSKEQINKKWKVVAIDCGVKSNIYRHLTTLGCEIISVPNTISVQEIMAFNPDGLFISNGPGDPEAVTSTVAILKEIAGSIPTFGICLGHQMLALALGATTWKLNFGHRGANQPVCEVETGKVEITSQNHGFCVDEQSLLDAGCTITHRHLNDDTVAGFRHNSLPIIGVQYHPESSPGPHDSAYLFNRFIEMMESHSLV